MHHPNLTDALLQTDDRIATLTLNRHDVRNALTGTRLIDDIVTVAEWVNRCDAVSVLIITAAGSAFSSGGNIKDMAERGGDFAGVAAEIAFGIGAASSAFRSRCSRSRYRSSRR